MVKDIWLIFEGNWLQNDDLLIRNKADLTVRTEMLTSKVRVFTHGTFQIMPGRLFVMFVTINSIPYSIEVSLVKV